MLQTQGVEESLSAWRGLGCSHNNQYYKGKLMLEHLLPTFALISVQKGGGGGLRCTQQPPAVKICNVN